MTHLKLRGYQEAALSAEAAYRAEHPDENRLAMEVGTGLGKTIIFAERIRRFLDSHDGAGNRALVLVHTDELIEQAVNKIRLVLASDDMPWTVGVVKAQESNDVKADVVVASVWTLSQPGRKEQISDVGYIVVDECHHATARTYVEILQWFGAMPGHDCPERPCWDCHDTGFISPPVPVLGVTATLKRTDGVGLGRIWHNVVFSRSMVWGARKGYLTDLIPYTITIPSIDAGATDAQLDAALCDSLAPEAIVRAWAERAWGYCEECADASLLVSDDVGFVALPSYCPDDHCPVGSPAPSTVLFAPLVASAQAFADAFNDAGVKAEVVHGAMPREERRAVLARYEAGVTTVLCNAMVLTEGWDSPRTKCVIVARPTKSAPLFVQMVGRGVRPWLAAEAPPREEQRCILLCVADTTTDLATYADLSEDPLPDGQDGKSLLAMQDEWDLGKDLRDEEPAYSGPVTVERWDEAVRRSTKAWKYTAGGVPFLPTAKRGQGYVFVTPVDDHWTVWAREYDYMRPVGQQFRTMPCATAPDLELAMALAEDEALEQGGDIGALLADKTRAWRKAVPSPEMVSMARRCGVPDGEISRILTSKAAGKAGKLSDLIDRMMASQVLDPIAQKIRERASHV